jgi:uncharacterized damage-inducible protein DinB
MMTNDTARGLLDFLLPQLEQEFATTRNVLAAVPLEKCAYKPSERCMSAIELANHIAGSEAFFLSGVVNGAFDWKQLELKTPAEVLAYCDQNIPALIQQVAALPDDKLAKEITFAIWTQPAVVYLNLHLKHSIHHRGQLSAYLRPMGAKVPSIYGPSADEPLQAAQAK